MGQKVNPTGLRIGVIKNWESRWYANDKDFGDTLVEDYKLREFLLETLAPAGVPKVEIERDAKRVYINIHCAKPGMVIYDHYTTAVVTPDAALVQKLREG